MTAHTFSERLRTRLAVLRARPRRGPRSLVWQPEPRGTGSTGRGRQIAAGIWHFAGEVVEAPGTIPWDIDTPSTPFEMQLHGQGWLDDLLALGTADARKVAQVWILDWARRYGRGSGPGWDAALTGRRLLRQISHAPVLLRGMEASDQARFFDLLYTQAGFLRRRWPATAAGLPRMEALTGLLYAGLTLEGTAQLASETAHALSDAAEQDVGEDGGIASRNPEALLEVGMLLGWSIDALRPMGDVPPGLLAAQSRLVPTLRSLRHADGGLARFHGGGRGRIGRVDRVLADSGIRARNDSGLAMGFAPMAHGRTSVIVDATRPPRGVVSGSAHASTLAFEMTSGACPVIVNCGPGGAFGPDWHLAGRATASHSTLAIEGFSSSRVGPVLVHSGRRVAPLIQTPRKVQWQRSASRRASTLIASHDGYGPSHGLTHLRRLVLSTDGRVLEGEDSLRAVTGADKERFEDAQTRAQLQGIGFDIRFHLHPDSQAEIDMGGRAVSITLSSGEVWVFRPRSGTEIALAPSVHLEPGRLKPRPSQQVVLSDRIVSYAATIDWTLTRAQEATELPPPSPDTI
ncbi:heparinase II/III family protein [Jannaschia sp. S6380]|uniref:heparinase II/III family protein n=1 Tax=Jannaschia sp. S6380 TaxID=2926408 RepID=UPI001FF456FE|nr:heparinase II/III family protein [Jannaschia sp. S6380]MCK0167863.1 heparinase II/III family protein [Jannaschia sp. S6380]